MATKLILKSVSQLLSRINGPFFFIVYVVNCFVYKNQHIIQDISSVQEVQWRGWNMDDLPYPHDRDKIKPIKQID